MYVERESLSVEPIYPHLQGPCMFFALKVCVCGNAKSYPSVLIVFDCILLCTYCIYHVPS